MANCGSLLKTALVAIALVVVAASGSTVEKVAPCCTAVDQNEITEPIVNVWIQKAKAPCVAAVIFQTEKDLLCKYVRAAWVPKKIREFREAKAQSKQNTTPSLLSFIVSTTTSSPSSTTSSPSSSSSSSPSSSSSSPSSSSPSSSSASPSSTTIPFSSSSSSSTISPFPSSSFSSSSSSFSSSPSSSSSPPPSSSSSTSEAGESFSESSNVSAETTASSE
ncbi:uncharacterized protein DDB_G0271670-like [Salarias fasciatus]|uniref:Chemokine interleukin-8-like domain-containing protein n=1 Tax=Salarias fasciatus TaxID=181472 RepID=A0A672GE49_SALFA|nr:uncharacterized protein DDB_G0271670-like [Salarias fasciatus]